MHKYINIAILSSFFCLWLNSYLTDKYELIIGFLFIFSVGIFHGANDLMLIKNINISKNNYSFINILTYYLLIVTIGVLLFVFFPFFALFSFIIVSGYHFGEQQLQFLNKNKIFNFITNIVYGIFILLLLFNCHKIEVSQIIFEITNISIPILVYSAALIGFSILLFLLFLYLYVYHSEMRTKIQLELFYLLVFSIIFLSSGLIWGFAIYFIIWHSIPSIIDQVKFLHHELTFKNFLKYFKSAFLYWIISLIGITALYFLFKDQKIFNALFFSFLAAITFPHVLVIIKMFEKSK
ncbi:MAG: Brp/Blh family beta-carotene 15,15'-dioxygenase [Flavobacterium sp.]|nr:Brp/Blh family beta-carotene 15,15'-dioxygenase [Flavobacterium sp.]